MIPWAAVDHGVFDTQPFAPEIFLGAWRVVEVKEYPMERVPARDDLVDLLITDRLAEGRKAPQNFAARAVEERAEAVDIFPVNATVRKSRVRRVPVHVQHQNGIIVA